MLGVGAAFLIPFCFPHFLKGKLFFSLPRLREYSDQEVKQPFNSVFVLFLFFTGKEEEGRYCEENSFSFPVFYFGLSRLPEGSQILYEKAKSDGKEKGDSSKRGEA